MVETRLICIRIWGGKPHKGVYTPDEVHPEVVMARQELDIDLSNQPQSVLTAVLNGCAVVAAMGCSTLELEEDVEVRDWALEDPHGKDMDSVRAVRDEVEQRLSLLLRRVFGKQLVSCENKLLRNGI